MQDKIQQHYDTLRQAEADAKYWLDEYKKQLKAEHEAKIAELETSYNRDLEQTRNQFRAKTSEQTERVQVAMERLKYAAAALTMEDWLGFPQEMPANAIKDSLRAGVIQRVFPALGIKEVPLLLPFIGDGHILVVSHGTTKLKARVLVKNLLLRALAMLNDGNTEYILIDPFGMGANLPFQSLPSVIRGETIHAEADEINAQLRRLTDQIRKGQAEKRFILAAVDFPNRFNQDALQRIISIAQQGVRNNIYAIIHVDSDVPLEGGFDPSPLLEASCVVFMTEDRTTARIEGTELGFVPDDEATKTLFDALLKKIGGS